MTAYIVITCNTVLKRLVVVMMLCLYFRESIRYFTSRGRKVFCVSLDANKAFNRVLHSGLYFKLLEKGVCIKFVMLLQ